MRSLVRVLLIVLPFSLTAGGARAELDASIAPETDLVGNWLVKVANSKRLRVLTIEKVVGTDERRYTVSAKYGWAAAKKRTPVTDAALVAKDNGYELSFVTGAGSRIVAVMTEPDRLSGTFTGRKGYVFKVVLTSASEAELKSAAVPLVRPNSEISLVYVGAWDCPSCRHWESSREAEWLESETAKAISYRNVQAYWFRDTRDLSRWPADLHWIPETGLANSGTPRFLVLVDGKVVRNLRGTGAWDREVAPLLNQLVQRRRAGG